MLAVNHFLAVFSEDDAASLFRLLPGLVGVAVYVLQGLADALGAGHVAQVAGLAMMEHVRHGARALAAYGRHLAHYALEQGVAEGLLERWGYEHGAGVEELGELAVGHGARKLHLLQQPLLAPLLHGLVAVSKGKANQPEGAFGVLFPEHAESPHQRYHILSLVVAGRYAEYPELRWVHMFALFDKRVLYGVGYHRGLYLVPLLHGLGRVRRVGYEVDVLVAQHKVVHAEPEGPCHLFLGRHHAPDVGGDVAHGAEHGQLCRVCRGRIGAVVSPVGVEHVEVGSLADHERPQPARVVEHPPEVFHGVGVERRRRVYLYLGGLYGEFPLRHSKYAHKMPCLHERVDEGVHGGYAVNLAVAGYQLFIRRAGQAVGCRSLVDIDRDTYSHGKCF